MKKIFLILALFVVAGLTSTYAQGGDPAVMAQRFKERVKPQLVDKVKLTDAQADKVIEVQFANRQQMRELRDLSEEERRKKLEEVQANSEKQYKAAAMTEEQIKAVNAFFEEQRRNMGNQRRGQ